MIEKLITRVKPYWWVIFPLGIIIWLFYVWLNCALWLEENCTGFRGKTVWDVLELLIIPATLAVVAVVLDKMERKADRERAIDNQREVALQNYFDSMTTLILDKNLRFSSPNDEVRTIAQAKTTSILEGLDADRKSKLAKFLCGMSLLKGEEGIAPIIQFSKANLMNVELTYANLEKADLSEVHLEGARLAYANLKGANIVLAYLKEVRLEWTHLERAYLNGTDLSRAILWGTYLEEASLEGVYLEGAYLVKATLMRANLEGAHLKMTNFKKANLCGANLKDADLSGANLEEAILEGAIMPDGKVYDPVVHTIQMLTAKNHTKIVPY